MVSAVKVDVETLILLMVPIYVLVTNYAQCLEIVAEIIKKSVNTTKYQLLYTIGVISNV